MQDKYVGDIGDYAKLALLRSLAHGSRRLGVVWCKNEGTDESNNDGKHRSYRKYKGRDSLRHCDEELFDGFAEFNSADARRIERLHRYLPGAEFHNEPIKNLRPLWISAALESTVDCDLVFFDPDNGIDFESHSQQVSAKHISLDELRLFWDRGQSLIVYHHLSRRKGGHILHIAEMRSTLSEVFIDSVIQVIHIRRGTSRVFFLIAQSQHRDLVSAAEQSLDALRILTRPKSR